MYFDSIHNSEIKIQVDLKFYYIVLHIIFVYYSKDNIFCVLYILYYYYEDVCVCVCVCVCVL